MNSELSASAASGSPNATIQDCPKEEKERVRIVVRDTEFQLCRGRKYVLEAGGEKFEGTTGEQGLVDQLIPKGAPTAKLAVWVEDGDDAEPYEWDLDLRKLHPVTTETGVQGRLHNLAFECGEQGADAPVPLANAKGEFESLFTAGPDDEPDSWRDEDQPPAQIGKKLGEVYESLEAKLLPEDDAWIPPKFKADDIQII